MKKRKRKSSIKKDRRFVANEIESIINNYLTGILESFKLESKKTKKIIAKVSKELSKKLAKEIKVEKLTREENDLVEEYSVSDQESKKEAILLPKTLTNNMTH